MKNNLISKVDELRYERTKRRMKRQEELTAKCVYGLENKTTNRHLFDLVNDNYEFNGKYHLISEGVVCNIDGEPYQIVSKGAVKEWYDNLDDDTILDIDLDHNVDSVLFRQIGTWKKSDIELVQNSDGRYSAYVDLENTLDDESLIVKELRRRNTPVALSIMFFSNGELVDYEGELIFNHQQIDIVGFAVVSEPQDAKSGNIILKSLENEERGEFSLNKDTFLEALKSAFSTEVEEEQKQEEVEQAQEEVEEIKEVEEEQVQEEVKKDDEELSMQEFIDLFKAELEPIKKEILEMKSHFSAVEKENKELKETIGKLKNFSINTKNTHIQNDKVGF